MAAHGKGLLSEETSTQQPLPKCFRWFGEPQPLELENVPDRDEAQGAQAQRIGELSASASNAAHRPVWFILADGGADLVGRCLEGGVRIGAVNDVRLREAERLPNRTHFGDVWHRLAAVGQFTELGDVWILSR